ncbi:MAG: formyltransferase family protein, partial [Actinomycetota bacterium]|nr:formyltransferase family protein [Actinomycetota bacterium]
YNHAIREALDAHGVELVVMAGYMRLLGNEVLRAYPGAVINLHPALLPAFPGASAIGDAFAYGVKVTGVTVHFADEEFDRGPIICQEPVRVEETDTVETLEAKIHQVEHRLLPEAIGLIADGRVRLDGRIVHIEHTE